ncbi:histone H2A deubiquitinase MYSM1-like isoform X1 [Dermacentor variabilis]|uniref:histone H2A deubiquitinase MYSM1-like isoform X1 n=1 Tax=Dermacentor variabilis TaxID=34621 RepID=UPI003F5BCB41
MASFEEDVCFWESVDVESDFQADTALFRDASCDDLLEFNDTFKPLWHTDARIAATIDGTVENEAGCTAEANTVEVKTEKQSPTAAAGTSGTPTARKKWTADEEALLLQCMEQHGNKWSKISALIKTKSTIQVKTHAHYLLKKNALQGKTSGQVNDTSVPVVTSKGPVAKPPKKQAKMKPQTTSRNENVIVLKEAEAIETLKNKFPESEIVSIDKSADEEDEIDIDCDGTDDVVFSPPGSPLRKSDAFVEVATPKLATDSSAEDTENETSPDRLLPEGLEKGATAAVKFEPPVAEVVLDKSAVSKDEKMVHSEFFSGSSSKTPERYLRIRNFIIDAWNSQKPRYLNKTQARQGLKNCGDVNCIGRIHDYLEQIGAINFGCSAQVTYQRTKYLSHTKPLHKRKEPRADMERPQRRKTASLDVLNIDVKGGGVTLEHGSEGSVISQTLVRSKPKPGRHQQNPFKLIPCRSYDEGQEPFNIEVSVTAFLRMDIHAHLLNTEVIGLLGGYYDEHRNCLVVSTAEACDSVSTDLECEMDSVSQTQAMDSLQELGCDVVGWYHSHPTFVPNPSVRDLTTQRDYQALFSSQGRPFVAAILSPFLQLDTAILPAKGLATRTKWWVVRDNDDTSRAGAGIPALVPYAFSVKLLKADQSFVQDVAAVIHQLVNRVSSCPARVELSKPYPWRASLRYLDKMLASLQFHITNSETSVEDATEILQAIHAALTDT